MKNKILALLFLVVLNPPSASADLVGILDLPMDLSSDSETESPINKFAIPVFREPSKTSPVVASISNAGPLTTSGQDIYMTRFHYEQQALAVIERKGAWYKVGFESAETQSEFPENFAVVGWVNLEEAKFKTISEFLQQSMVSLNIWDHMLYKVPGSSEKFKVVFPQIKIQGTIRLKPEKLNSTSVPCEILFYADSNKQKLIGICPQNFSFIHGAQCENPDDLANVFCLKVYVLNEANGLYQIAFKKDLVQFRKNQMDVKLLKTYPEFHFHTGWVDKTHFENLSASSPTEVATAQGEMTNGASLRPIKDADVVEHKTVQGQDWVRVKIKQNCSDEKIYGEGWLPVRLNKKINFNFSSGGC
ncbi:MAG: hypothetical protein ACXWC9_11250 [Pseudobdellovibrionaceae bacterium]